MAPLSRGKRRESTEEPETRGIFSWRLSRSSPSRPTPGPRDHRALDGNQNGIEPPWPPRHGGCFLSRALKHRAGGISTALRSIPVTAAPSRLLGPRFRGGNEGRARRNRNRAEGGKGRRTLSASYKRTAGSRHHRALDGIDEGTDPPWPPEPRRCRLFTSTQASCRRNIHCAEIHSRGSGTTAAPGPPLSRGKRRESAEESEKRGGPNLAENSLIVFPANAGTQGPPSSGRQPRGHRTTTASAARRVLSFKSAQASCRRKAHCAEVHSRGSGTTAAPGPLAFLPLVFPANAGTQGPPSSGRQPRGHRTAMASAAQKVPSFHERPSIVPADSSPRARPFPWQRHQRGSWAPALAGETTGERGGIGKTRRARPAESPLIAFPANAGIQGPPGSGRQPRGHRTAMASAARRVPSFKSAQASCRRRTRCAEVRSVPAAPLRFLGPRFPTPRLPGERRHPGTTGLWTAIKRASNRTGPRSTEGAVFSRAPKHRAGGKLTALRSAP